MKLLFDLLPIFAFFIAFKLGKSFPIAAAAAGTGLFGPIAASTDLPDLVPIMLATVAAIVITLVQVSWLLARRAPIKPALWLSAVLIVVFGGLTIWLRSELFIKWKPTLLYWCFTLLLLGGRLIARRNLLGALLGDEVRLPERVWNRLLWAWSTFFLVLGIANLFVAYNYTTEQWVDFKTFGPLALTVVFSLATAAYMARHWQHAQER